MAKNILDPEIWYKIIGKLNQSKLKYVLVGGAALVIHGLPRSTLDIDIYVPAKEDVLDTLFKIAGSLNLKSEQKDILSLRHSPKLFIDQWICFSYEGQDILDVFLAGEKEFIKLLANSELKKDRKTTVRVASLKDIEMMKKKTGRPIDIADLEFIKEVRKYKKR